jgi:hypothetical protein
VRNGYCSINERSGRFRSNSLFPIRANAPDAAVWLVARHSLLQESASQFGLSDLTNEARSHAAIALRRILPSCTCAAVMRGRKASRLSRGIDLGMHDDSTHFPSF